MNIKAYTIKGCSSCKILKELFERAQVEYDDVLLGKNISKEQFKNLYPSVVTFPFVVIDEQEIGGLVETAKLFLEKGLVSTRK
jgi:glutaredoxin 3